MPTLEPIVVNEKKELETPTFFKKDVEQIVLKYFLSLIPEGGEENDYVVHITNGKIKLELVEENDSVQG